MSSLSFKFSQERDLRHSLAQCFEMRVATWIDITKNIDTGYISDCEIFMAQTKEKMLPLEKRKTELEKIVRGKRHRVKEAKEALISVNKEIAALDKELGNYERAKYRQIDFNRVLEVLEEIATLYLQGEPIAAIGKFYTAIRTQSTGYESPVFDCLVKHKEFTESDLRSFRIWAKEKVKAHCIGFVARAQSHNDICLEGLTEHEKFELAVEKMFDRFTYYPTIMNFCDEIQENPAMRLQVKQKYNTYSSLNFLWCTQKHYATPYYSYIDTKAFDNGLHAQYRDVPVVQVDSLVNTAIKGLSSWYNLVAPLSLVYREKIRELDSIQEKAEKEKETKKESDYLLAQKSLIAEIEKPHNGGNIPIPSYWDKNDAMYTEGFQFVTSPGLMFLASSLEKNKELASRVVTEKSKTKTFPNGKRPEPALLLKQIEESHVHYPNVLGCRKTTDRTGKELYLAYFSNGAEIFYYKFGYIQLLARLGILANMARYEIASSNRGNVLVVRAHDRTILAIVQQFYISPDSPDYLDIKIYNQLKLNATKSASVAAWQRKGNTMLVKSLERHANKYGWQWL